MSEAKAGGAVSTYTVIGNVDSNGKAQSLATTPLSVATSAGATGTLANVSGSATTVALFASNAAAKSRIITNDSTSNLYVKFGATASVTSFTYLVKPGAVLEFPIPLYTGAVEGIWDTATGAARCTEVTA